MMTKIKICGLTREGDAVLCADRGADFLGFIFVESSPRFIEPDRAATIAGRLRERETWPKLVGVFRDASVEYMKEIVSVVGLDLAQLHGSETDGDIKGVGVPVVKGYRVRDELPDTTEHDSAEWVLFDTFDERRIGGTGRRFDWSLLSMYPRTKPFFLSGGINADNIAAAISLVRPDGIDIASGVESEPGVKDRVKIDKLFERIKRV